MSRRDTRFRGTAYEFFSFDSSHKELSAVYQQIFSISYGFWDNLGQRWKKCILADYENFNFFIWSSILMGFFHWIPREKCNKSYSKHFFVSLIIFEIKGAQRGKKCHFSALLKFLFVVRFWWDFFHWIPLKRAFSSMSTDFFYLLWFSK